MASHPRTHKTNLVWSFDRGRFHRNHHLHYRRRRFFVAASVSSHHHGFELLFREENVSMRHAQQQDDDHGSLRRYRDCILLVSCRPTRSHVPRSLTLCQILSVIAFMMGAGSILGLPAVLILLCSCCARVDYVWFMTASVSALLAAAEAATTAYYLLNWPIFWRDIIAPIRRSMGKTDDADGAATADRVYAAYADYEFVGYIAMGVAALWLLCSMLLCYFSGSYKQFLRDQSAKDGSTSNDDNDDHEMDGGDPSPISIGDTTSDHEAPMFIPNFGAYPSAYR
jgi:hypothetical protein